MSWELVTVNDICYAAILWKDTDVDRSTFFSRSEDPLQVGILCRPTGFVEPAHYHPRVERPIFDTHQVVHVIRGALFLDLFTQEGHLARSIRLAPGDTAVIMDGPHRIRIIEDAYCLSVKQGPFLGVQLDKVDLDVRA